MPCVNLIDTTERRVRSRNRRKPREPVPVFQPPPRPVFEPLEFQEQAQVEYGTFYQPISAYQSSNFDQFGCPTFYNRGSSKTEKQPLKIPAISSNNDGETIEHKEIEIVQTRRTRFNTWIPVITN